MTGARFTQGTNIELRPAEPAASRSHFPDERAPGMRAIALKRLRSRAHEAHTEKAAPARTGAESRGIKGIQLTGTAGLHLRLGGRDEG